MVDARRINARGFTIVELLIVIVVIALLAGVTVTAFGGVRQNAEYAKLKATILTYEKAIKLQRTAEGRTLSAANWVCLGNQEDYPANDDFTLGQCSNGTAPNYWSQQVRDALKPYMSTVPNASFPARANTYGGLNRGLVYDELSGHVSPNGTIVYFVDADEECPIGRWRGELTADAKFCEYVVVY